MTAYLGLEKTKVIGLQQYNGVQGKMVDCYLMRHAQSKFNEVMENCSYQSLSMQAKNIYQMNLELIDSEITEKGIRQIKQLKLIEKDFQIPTHFDIIFVSPLNRTLETAKLLLQFKKIEYKKIIVIPRLTQVLSKICDFSNSIQQKITKYNHYDFNILKKQHSKTNFWQDLFVNTQFQQEIDKTKNNGQRYVKVLDKIFPNPLESVDSCVKRSIDVMKQIKQLSEYYNAEKILVITHNRILKNILTQGNSEKIKQFKILKNCQIRKIII